MSASSSAPSRCHPVVKMSSRIEGRFQELRSFCDDTGPCAGLQRQLHTAQRGHEAGGGRTNTAPLFPYTFALNFLSTMHLPTTANAAPTSNIVPQNICSPMYVLSPSPPPAVDALLVDWNDRIAPEMGGPAKMPGDIATMNIPVRLPICEGSSVICATHEEATDE